METKNKKNRDDLPEHIGTILIKVFKDLENNCMKRKKSLAEMSKDEIMLIHDELIDFLQERFESPNDALKFMTAEFQAWFENKRLIQDTAAVEIIRRGEAH